MRNPCVWTLPQFSIALGQRTAIMGILNVTPDSFSDGGEYFDRERAIARGKEIEQEGAGIVLMHSRGSRETLHKQKPMDDTLREVTAGLALSTEKARSAGIADDAIVVDPGIGFGKTADESLTVLKSLHAFSKLGYPLLV